jgi:hypothetical protein
MLRGMHVVQFFLPLKDNAGQPFAREAFSGVRRELTERFGGVTAYLRSPAQGLWEDEDGDLCRDEVVLFEVMDPALDVDWWRAYRTRLQHRFAQDAVLLRATESRVL